MNNINDFYPNFEPKVVCEIGVYNWECSQARPFLDKANLLILVEPNYRFSQEVKNGLDKNPKIQYHSICIADYNGSIRLYRRNIYSSEDDPSAFIEGLPSSPVEANDNFEKSTNQYVECPCSTFDTIDPGNIDLLLIDIEGAEWFAIKHLISRPKFISVETHYRFYQNPFMKEILNWMENNNYIEIGKDGSDSLFQLK